jgi:hypothetical protein
VKYTLWNGTNPNPIAPNKRVSTKNDFLNPAGVKLALI